MADSRGRDWGVGQSADVRIISKNMVIPAKPTQRHSYFLSCLDILWRFNHYNQRVIFYERALLGSGDCGERRTAVVEALKSSLALCLVHYYPWCGRLSQPVAAAGADDRLFIDCNDGGVEFVEADMDLPISRLSLQGFQTKPFFEQLCQKVDYTGDCLYSSPLLSVQATFFSDGGLSLGVSQSHVVADGQALWDFMVSWGECARGLPLTRRPLMDRQVLAVPNPPVAEKAEWDFVVGSSSEVSEDKQEAASNRLSPGTEPSSAGETSVGSQASAQGLVADGKSVGTAPPSAFAEADRTHCVFILPASAVTQLKSEDGGVHTTYEVIGAHFWQRLTHARGSPPHEPSKFFVITNFRGRMKPPLPPSYFGNAVGFGISLTTTRKICNESLHATGSRIHDTIVQTVEESKIKGCMQFLEVHQHDLLSKMVPKLPQGQGLMVASSTRFPVYEVDFGWGKPAAVRSPKVPGHGELVFFGGNPKLGPGDVEICSFLPTYVLRRLLKDALFLGVCSCDPFEDEEVH